MNFEWAINTLKEGKKVTRRSLAGDPPIYLYWNKADDTIMRDYGARTDSKWQPSLDSLVAEDWEEYVEPKKDTRLHSITGEIIKVMPEEMPLWPGVNADGYARMSKDSDVIIHDGVYRPKKKPVEEPDIDTETNKAIALVARNIAENLVELLRNPSVQLILQGELCAN